MNEEASVTITRKEYDQLRKDSDWLACLEEAGVDNWEGFEEAARIRESSTE